MKKNNGDHPFPTCQNGLAPIFYIFIRFKKYTSLNCIFQSGFQAKPWEMT